ncbi:M16 family metallopeptidase [Mesohalobacter halotolerans]|uniref:Insulinase family protein n=1 Tax=Mesohalobacter halotolerans TaxID=1883405 RepID=A0A4U5TRG6_9FLAO|nr:pitrilysin family protein [Mesohalobacter halotolerans]MBS3738313.1 insulinase family protein [Psychroflexus sp.]TKS56850.1 insulinase family protein [Mesohalobacter halotolerans]
MKFKFSYILLLCFVTTSLVAQIDRSQMPKPGPAPEINLGEPDTFKMDNGLEVLVVEDHKLPRVSVRLVIDNKPHRVEKPGVATLTSALLGTGTKNLSKDEYNEEIEFLGATVNLGAEYAYASSLTKYFPRVFELMADGGLNPVFTQEEFDAEKAKLIEGLKADAKNVGAIANRVSSVLAYSKNHPYGQYTTEESVEKITLQDVKNYYRNFFVPGNAYMAFIGDINKKEAKKLVKDYFKNWKAEKAPEFELPEPRKAQYRQIDFVNMPNAVQSEIIAQNTVDLKMTDEDYFPVLVANQILGGSFGSYLNMNLREDKGYTYGARSSIGADRYASRFRASVSVRNEVTDSAVVEILKEIKRIRTEPVDAQKLEDTKKKFAGNFVLRLERPSTVANYALNIRTENLPEDFYKTYLQKVNAVTQEDVQRVAAKYFDINHLQIVIAGKGSEVVENLEKVKFEDKSVPVLYYDKYGNKTDKPEFNKPLPEGVTVQTIFDDYIEAIGGKDKVESVENAVMKGTMSAGPQSFNVEMIMTQNNKSLMEVGMNGMTVMKSTFDGEKGYDLMQGQRKDKTPEQIEEAKLTEYLFLELKDASKFELVNLESTEQGDAYVIQITDDQKSFYSVETGLKIKTVTTQEQMGRTMESTLKYTDYKPVEGVLMPHKLVRSIGPQNIEINFDGIMVNQDIPETKFQ